MDPIPHHLSASLPGIQPCFLLRTIIIAIIIIMPSNAGHYPPGQQQQQQQSVIQKWALVRPDTLQDLLARQRGTSSVHHGGGTNQEDKDCHHLPIVAAGLGGPLCVLTRQQHGHLVEVPVGHQQRNFRAPAGKRRQLGDGWEAPPMGRRQLLQDHLSGHRGSHTRMHCGTRVGHHAGDTVADCYALEHSLALYQPCLQQVLSLTRVEGCGERRRCRLNVLRLIPTRALALLRQLTDTGSVRWRHGTLKLMGGPTWVPGSKSLHLPGCPVWIPRIYLMAIYCPSEET